MSTDRFHPLVSIVIPVYNGANYMREAIDSALAQTYDRTEVIVVNDGSRDEGETDRIARSYGDRIRYFTKANGGCGSALNFGIERMRGDYFSWLSHDDLYLPHKIEHQIALLGRVSDKRTILFGGWEVFDKYGKSIVHVRPNIVHSQRKLDTPLYALMRGLIHGCSLLVPTALFRDIGTFDESLPTTQDYALWFRFMRTAPVHFDSEILIRSRAHPEQGSHSVSGHIEECNTLWCGFLSELTDEEMIAMEGSRYLFLRRTEAFLSQTPYGKARALAAEMALAELERTKVSVVIPFHNRIMWALEAVESALEQTHSNVEILLVDDGSTDDLSPISIMGILDTWYRSQARAVYPIIVTREWSRMGYRQSDKPRLIVRKMDRRWGSLSPSGILTLNTSIIKAPEICIEYVICHELCHAEVPDHSAEFYGKLSRYMPDWEARKSRLEMLLK